MSGMDVLRQLNLGCAHHQAELTGELNPDLNHLPGLDVVMHCQHMVGHLRDLLPQELKPTFPTSHSPQIMRQCHHTPL